MGKERLKRVLIITVIGGLMVWGIISFAKWQKAKKTEDLVSPVKLINEKIGELGGEILGKAAGILPGSKEIKEKIIEEENTKNELQTIKKTEFLESQTKEIIEILKQLPEGQLKQIKKQIFKDFCQRVMEE